MIETDALLSLWAPLHDGKLLVIHSDPETNAVTLEIEVLHLQKFHQLGTDALFLISLHEVDFVQVKTWLTVDEITQEEQETTMAWNDFVAALPANEFDISEANVVAPEIAPTLQLKGMLYGNEFDDQYFQVVLRAKALTIELGAGNPITLAQLIELGQSYWDTWKEKGS